MNGRFGSFEIFKASDPLTGYQGPSTGNIGILHKLLDYTINNFFPQVSELFFNVLKQMRRVYLYDAFGRNPGDLRENMKCDTGFLLYNNNNNNNNNNNKFVERHFPMVQ